MSALFYTLLFLGLKHATLGDQITHLTNRLNVLEVMVRNVYEGLSKVNLRVTQLENKQESKVVQTLCTDDSTILGGGRDKLVANLPGSKILMPPQQVGFHVQNDNVGDRSAPPTFVMPFNKIILNLGGHWDTLTHIFIIPVKGVYAFHLTVQKSGSNSDLYVHIMNDSKKISGAHVTNTSSYGTGSSTGLAELEQSNKVYVQVTQGTVHGFDWRGVGSVQFTGYLLYTLN